MGNEILSEKELEHIKTHKYNTTGYSWLDNKMNPFWIKCASMLPHWLSPNMVTILGLLNLTLAVVLILPFDQTISQALPSWIYVAFAILVFNGQTLDAIDGKHARNTNRSSPLGQLMDHGCDAFSNSFVIIMICQAHLLGHTIYTLVVQVLVQLPFYIITWEEHYTGVLITHIDNMGVTEFQFIAMGSILLPAFLGPEFTHSKIFGYNFTFTELLVYCNCFYALKTFIQRYFLNFRTIDDYKRKFDPMISLFVLVAAELLCYKLKLYHTHTIYIIILNGLYFGFMASKLIVCNMSKKKIENFAWDNLVYLIAIIFCIIADSVQVELVVIPAAALLLIFRYAYYMISITIQLMKYLNISF